MITPIEENDLTGIDDAKENATRPFELYKRLTTVVVSRENFLNVVCDALSEYKYVGPNQRADLVLACRYVENSPISFQLLISTSFCRVLMVHICVPKFELHLMLIFLFNGPVH